MKTGIVTYAYKRFDTAEGARIIKAHGYDGIDYQRLVDTETELFAVFVHDVNAQQIADIVEVNVT